MKKFLAICLGTMRDEKMKEWMAQPEEARKAREKEGMEAWGKWVADHSASIVDQGAPIGKTKKADPSGISDTKNAISGYTIVEAESLEEAAKMFEGHPHFTIFPGESIEIMECLPMPTLE
jgi:hypothetical protein